MPLPSDRMPPSPRSQPERINRLERALTELRAARRSSVLARQNLPLAGGWDSAGATWQTPQCLLSGGMVHLTGAAVPGLITTGTTLTVLPSGYLPAADHEVRVPGGSASAAVDLLITAATGLITIQATAGTVTRVSLTGIAYPAA